MMKNIRDTVPFQIKEAGVTLEIESIPPCTADLNQINQVFTNIISNALARTIVERHQGDIWVESEPDKGSKFFISLPS